MFGPVGIVLRNLIFHGDGPSEKCLAMIQLGSQKAHLRQKGIAFPGMQLIAAGCSHRPAAHRHIPARLRMRRSVSMRPLRSGLRVSRFPLRNRIPSCECRPMGSPSSFPAPMMQTSPRRHCPTPCRVSAG
jgi:hypothetical protein